MEKAKNRLIIFGLVAATMFLIIAIRIALMSFSGSPGSQTSRPAILRGPIEDRRGMTLAMTEEASTIALAPNEILDIDFTAEHLARYLDISSDDILERYYFNNHRSYFLLQRQVDNFTAGQIMELNLPGVHREFEYRRIYPSETLASNLLGFVGRDQTRALAGLERNYHEILMDTPIQGNRGPTLSLTIDSLIQYRLEQELGQAFEESGSERASGILMDLRTGEVLAMANFPNFNPNRYHLSTPQQRGNWAIRLNYEPGSTVKIFMAASLIQERAVDMEERFFCDGIHEFGNSMIRCRQGGNVIRHGHLTLGEIIEKSCNVGIIQAMGRIPRDQIYNNLRDLGFNQRTGVLPAGSGETAGYLPELRDWVPSSRYYFPIGQGFSVTPIQLLTAATSLGPDGHIPRPYLVRKVQRNSRVLDETQVFRREGPFNSHTADRLQQMMERVVTDGTGRRARIPGIRISGKTGTGEKSSARGYEGEYIASFIGYFPAEHPRYAGIILFDEPGPRQTGGSIAAPVFGRFVQSILPLLEGEESTVPVSALEAAPQRPTRIDPSRIPDLRGMSARDAIHLLSQHYDIKPDIRGSGYVYRQEPAPGTPANQQSSIILYMDTVD